MTWTSAARAAGGVCVLVAKRARCCASAPRPLLRVPWARARAVTRIDARFAATHVPVVPRAADFHRVFAGIGSIRCRRRVARFKMCVSCNGDAGRGCSRFMCWTARFVWFGHLRLLQSSDSRVCNRAKTQRSVHRRRLGRSEHASAVWAWGTRLNANADARGTRVHHRNPQVVPRADADTSCDLEGGNPLSGRMIRSMYSAASSTCRRPSGRPPRRRPRRRPSCPT